MANCEVGRGGYGFSPAPPRPKCGALNFDPFPSQTTDCGFLLAPFGAEQWGYIWWKLLSLSVREDGNLRHSVLFILNLKDQYESKGVI